ncbi:hypothetical protein FNV43_RR26913 [Rhamnella rubrinervis]|uniref:Bet v I/Major latex protein domain-containing protein n=1 Tax=Rhamnella rubrinervis TaxID=2594499 RepID=A0A8K0GMZ1_9ROSA|nr:hypothetical protein FNV43_RR26913 [Rhamnella rubrinervis]
MAAIGKVEKEIEIQTPAEKLFKIFKSQCHHMPNMAKSVHAVDVHEGDWEKEGSIKHWKYNLDGRDETFKEKVEIDEENKAVTFIAVGGHVLDHFKNYKGTFKFTPNGDKGCLVKITLDYEKRTADDHDPIDKYMDLVVGLVKDIDDHLILQA